MAPSYTVWTSDVHGASASGRQIASFGPHAGRSFSIQPTSPIRNIAKPFISVASWCGLSRVVFARRCEQARPLSGPVTRVPPNGHPFRTFGPMRSGVLLSMPPERPGASSLAAVS